MADTVVCGSDVPAGRPAPYMIFRAMERLGVTDVARVLVAGDTPRDLEAGTNSGAAMVVGVLSEPATPSNSAPTGTRTCCRRWPTVRPAGRARLGGERHVTGATIAQRIDTTAAAVWRGGDQIAVERVAVPRLGPGDVLVRVRLATVCGSDRHTVSGRRDQPCPSILGHEAVGEIVAVGEAGDATSMVVTCTSDSESSGR